MATRGKVIEVDLAEAKLTDKLSVEEVTELTSMSHGRVCQLLRSGEMKGHKLRGIVWEVTRGEAERFIETAETANRPGRPRGK